MAPSPFMFFSRFLASSFLYLVGLFILGCGGSGDSPKSADNLPPTSTPEIAWLQQASKPFISVEPDSSESDLAFLDGLIGDAAIIGLGEATHGSSEFQKMKHRLFRYLVQHKGVTAFGLEAKMGLCRAIDQYVMTGQGDPIQAVKGQGYWIWSTQEMLDLVIWMRAYNLDPSHTKKLRFFGFDIEDGGTEMNQVLAYLLPFDPQASVNLSQLYAPYRPFTFGGGSDYVSAPLTLQTLCHGNIQAAYQWMLDRRVDYSAVTGADAYEWALRMAKVVLQNETMNASQLDFVRSGNFRDLAMAENAEWCLQRLGSETKAVISAHNGHINKEGWYPGNSPLGERLSEVHGAAYLAVGFAFDSGSFNARPWDPSAIPPGAAVQAFSVGPAHSGTSEYAFAQAGLNLAILDMRNLNLSEPGPAWLNQPHRLREVGAVWSNDPGFITLLPARFHALIFLKTVTATKLLP